MEKIQDTFVRPPILNVRIKFGPQREVEDQIRCRIRNHIESITQPSLELNFCLSLEDLIQDG